MKIAKTFKCPRYLDNGTTDETPVDVQLNKYLKSNQQLDIYITQYINMNENGEECLFVVFKEHDRVFVPDRYSYKENRGNQYNNGAWNPPRSNYRY